MDKKITAIKTNIFLHWCIAYFFITILIIGFFMDDLPDGYIQNSAYSLHESLGFIFIFFAIARLLWRYKVGRIVENPNFAIWEIQLRKTIKYTLLAIIIAMPISGLMITFGEGDGINIFGYHLFNSGNEIYLLKEAGEEIHSFLEV